ncbi:NlpC/P60 family protein [Lactobacillus gasseri]|uniref:NlpC/P60 family protein n=1 Tax=Lactobacillus gasseri TaxID=1596 RepID=UPI0028EA5569|nr:NlpC/P60 family protein [Lactobacillus gasseri]MDT9590006.1 NlpC/P60 family protein [Lactobacillus gasseri]MDT9611198.1 NlpC/P60 family protein [Lactobacillus gasseri]MDT9621900.1 NlpC/P60 family protein [Lactobacillus gasseri]
MTIKSKVIKLTTAASFAVAGIATLSAAKLNSLSFNNTAQASTIQAPAKQIGVVKVNSKTGESVAVWNSYEDGKQQTGKYLPHESSWKTYKKVKTVKGETWYNLGGDQWISGDDVQEEAPIALTADLSAVKAAVSQVPAANVASNATADAQTAVASVNNAQQAATTNNASVATAPVQTNTAATAQQTSVAAQAPVAQTTAQQSTYTASTNNTYVAPAKTNYYAQANTTVKTQQAATYSAPAQNTTATKPAQHQTQQASSQAAQPATQQASTQSSSTAQTVVNAAKSQIGKPYVWGATGPNAYDCSGLVQYAYSQAGKNIGRTTYQQAGAGQHVSVSQAQAGDILMWGEYHDAIYVGNNQYVHAPQPGQNVTQATISSYFMPDYAIRVR